MKRNRTKILTMALALVFVVAMAVGCGTTTPGTSSTSADSAAPTTAPLKDVTITYATIIGTAESDMMGVVALDFVKQNPNVTFETQVIDAAVLTAKLELMIKSNTLPDLFWWNALPMVEAYGKNPEAFTDLTPYYDDAFMSALTPAALVNLKTSDGKIVGFPAEMQVQAWLHNKALFDQYGLTIPTTSDELIADVKVFKANNVVTIAMGTKDTWPTWGYEDWTNKWGITAEGTKIFQDANPKFSQSKVVEAFNFIAELADLGAFPANNSTMTWVQVVELFNSGKAAMISIPSDQLAKVVGTPVEKDTVYTWGITFPNSPYDQKLVPGGVTNGFGVSSKAGADPDKIAAIVALNKYRFTEAGFKLSLTAGFNLPCSLPVDISTFGKIVQDQAKLIADPTANIQRTAVYSWYGDSWEMLYDEINMAEFNLPYGTIEIGLIDGSLKAKDIPILCAKFDTYIANVQARYVEYKAAHAK